MDELLGEFLTESAENIAELDNDIVSLEQNPNNPELLSNIFRTMHTIKGTCGFIGLPRLEKIAHAGENVLGKIRDGEIGVNQEIISVVLECLDNIKWLLGELEAHEKEPDGSDADLISRLDLAASGELVADKISAEPSMEEEVHISEEKASENNEIEEVFVESAEESPELSIMASSIPEEDTVSVGGVAKGDAELGSSESSIANKTIRVHVALLENLMTMVSELVLTRNQLMQLLRSMENSEFTVPLQRLNHVTSELQDGVMKTRMQPIGNAWSKLPRLVRDLAKDLKKKIDLEMIGEETELDRQVLELIKDPLTHMVRNSVDHGIESPQDRIRTGKSDTGKLILRAYHEGGHINIEISDDGHGLNLQKIKQKAITNGLATEAELENLSDAEIRQFIFRPGFSTAAKVTNVSGRGVGMDVVRTNIEKIGGTIDLESIEGRGTRFNIKIPLTLAIISALIVEAGRERFAIPQIGVLELVRVSASSDHKIEEINGSPFLRLRDHLLPLVNLSDLLRLPSTSTGDIFEQFIIVTQVGNYTFGIIVDQVFETQEIVVKPVAPIIRHIPMFSGNTILGDGSVVMILDPNGIASAIGKISVDDQMIEEEKDVSYMTEGEKVALLIFRAGSDAPKAVPLALIARLEEVDVGSIEHANGQCVVQYRNKLMPLMMVDHSQSVKSEGRQPVLVFTDQERYVGLMVEEIVDIVEEQLEIKLKTQTSGVFGSTVIHNKTMEIIDADYYIRQAYPDWFKLGAYVEEGAAVAYPEILLIDDSVFFRNLLVPFLTVDGYKVTAASSGEEGLVLLEGDKKFDAIICDIELNGMNGFEFAQRVRALETHKDVPLLALSGHSTPEDFERGRDAGFTDYLAKHDRDALLQALKQMINYKRKMVAA